MSNELTYEQIVEHIIENKEIPNAVNVPNIILDDSKRSESKMIPRNKPWEVTNKDNETEVSNTEHEKN